MPSSSISSHHSLATHGIHPHYFYSHPSSIQLTSSDTLNSNLGIGSMRSSPIPWSPSPTPPPQRNYLPVPTSARPSGTLTPGPTTPILGPTPELNKRGGRNQKGERGGIGGRTSRDGRARTRQQAPSEDQQDESSSQPRRKGRNRNMTPQEKLYLIRECCEHAEEYKPRNKLAFWEMIRRLLREKTGYDLMEPRNTVTRWVKARIDELVEEEMGSGTQVEQDDFKAAVEQFAGRMETVQKDLDEQVKDKKANAAEMFEAARLQSDMVFGLDDEPIPV